MLSRLKTFFEDPNAPPMDSACLKNTQVLGRALLGWLPHQDNVIATHLSGNERQMAIFYKNGSTHWLDLAETRSTLRRMMAPHQRRRYLSDLSDPNFVQRLDQDRLA